MQMRGRIEEKLTAALAPSRLAVIDESHRHAGHSGSRDTGETHFRVEIVSVAFEGKGRVARQRMINDLLAEELRTGVHALSLVTLTPTEDAVRR